MAYAAVEFCDVGGALALYWGVVGAIGEVVSDLGPGFMVGDEVTVDEDVEAWG